MILGTNMPRVEVVVWVGEGVEVDPGTRGREEKRVGEEEAVGGCWWWVYSFPFSPHNHLARLLHGIGPCWGHPHIYLFGGLLGILRKV